MVLTAAVLRCGKQMEKINKLVLFLDSLFPKTEIHIYICEMLPVETKQSGDKLLPHLELWWRVFLGEISCSQNYSMNEKKKEQQSYKIGTWNVRTLN